MDNFDIAFGMLVALNRVEDLAEKGGPGSGNFGHAGRPGEVGGSSPSGEGTTERQQVAGWNNGKNEKSYQRFVEAREKVPERLQSYLSHDSAGELEKQGVKPYLSDDRQTGFVIAPDGYFGNLFSLNHHGADGVRAAIALGAVHGDCFDGKLPGFYAQFGFKEYKREPNWTKGEPDVVYIRLEGKVEKAQADIEKLRDKQRKQMVRNMKEKGMSYEEADDAFLEMVGEEE